MRLALDISSLTSGHRYRGLGFYTQRLLEQLKTDPKIKLLTFRKQLPLGADLIHYPAFTLFTRPPQKTGRPTVATVHDLIPLKYPEHYPLGIKARFYWCWQKRFLRSIDAVLTDSQASRQDLIKLAGLKPEQVFVIYLAADEIFRPLNKAKLQLIKAKYSLANKFVLYVGDLNWNKNIVNLARMCLDLKFPLVVVGQAAVSPPQQSDHPELKDLIKFQQLAKANPQLIIRLGFVPTKDLVKIYNLATCYCQPSRDEGFGLPVLEAMACGCPVLTSRRGSLPEICGKADLKFSQKNLKACWRSDDLKLKMSRLGLSQAKKFSWGKTARDTIKVYEKIA